MTVIQWSFEGQDGSIKINEEDKTPVILTDGQIMVRMSHKKMVGYMNWIIQQELKHGGL